MKKTRLLLFSCLSALLWVNAAAVRSASADSKPFVVAYNQWIGYVGLFVAQDNGYFKAAGLNVQPKMFPGPADGVPLLATGQIDAALTTADTVILLNQRTTSNPATCVYVIDTSDGADGVIAQKDIKTIKDLKGKTVAATIGQCNELLLLMALKDAGMKPGDINITNMDADTAGAAIVAGTIPAAVTWEPWLTKASTKGAHVIFSSHQAPNIILDVIAASKQTMSTRSADLRAFVAAYAKGAAYAKAHPDFAAKVSAKYLGTSVPDAKSMLTKLKLYNASQNVTLIGVKSPGPVFASAAVVGKFFVSQKELDSMPDVSKTYTASYLPK